MKAYDGAESLRSALPQLQTETRDEVAALAQSLAKQPPELRLALNTALLFAQAWETRELRRQVGRGFKMLDEHLGALRGAADKLVEEAPLVSGPLDEIYGMLQDFTEAVRAQAEQANGDPLADFDRRPRSDEPVERDQAPPEHVDEQPPSVLVETVDQTVARSEASAEAPPRRRGRA